MKKGTLKLLVFLLALCRSEQKLARGKRVIKKHKKVKEIFKNMLTKRNQWSIIKKLLYKKSEKNSAQKREMQGK